MTDQPDLDVQFYQMVISLQSQAWQSLGKVASPMTGKIERNMEQAKFSIDMLEMFQRKTKGNLSDEEAKLLEHALYELRMNYLDEASKDKKDKKDKKNEQADEAGEKEKKGEKEEKQEKQEKEETAAEEGSDSEESGGRTGSKGSESD